MSQGLSDHEWGDGNLSSNKESNPDSPAVQQVS